MTRFSLMGDDEDLTAPLLDQRTEYAKTLAATTSGRFIPRAGPEAEARQQPWSPDVQSSRDPALTQQWQDAERQGLSQYMQRSNGYPGLGEYAGSGLAAGFDALANAAGGRAPKDFRPGHEYMPQSGLPSLMSGTQQLVDRNRAQEEQDAQKAGEFALKARAQKDWSIQNQLRTHELQQQDIRIQQAADAERRRVEAQNRMLDPNNPQVNALKGALIKAGANPEIVNAPDLDQKSLNALAHRFNIDFGVATTPQVAESKATIAGAEQDARNASNINAAPAMGAAEGVGKARGLNNSRAAEAATAAATTAASTGSRLATEEPYEQGKRGEQFAKDFAAKNDNLLSARKALQDVLDRAGPNGDIPGLSRTDRVVSAINRDYPLASTLFGIGNSPEAQLTAQDLALLRETIQTKLTGANAATQQSARIALATLGNEAASAEDKKKALQHTAELIDSEIAGAASPRPADAEKVLKARGLSAPKRASSHNDWSQYEVK